MAGKTAAPWEIPFSEANDEPKEWPAEQRQQSERIATLFGEHVVTIKTQAGAYTAASGELGIQETAGAVTTLPSATTKDRIIGVTCKASSCKITTSGGAVIYGDFVKGEPSLQLAQYQHILLQADGSNWTILAGEPKRESVQVEHSYTKAEAEAGVTPSATRPSSILLTSSSEFGGVTIGAVATLMPSGTKTFSFELLAGQLWAATVACHSITLLK
jgi:hypothetical protein